MFRMVMVTLCLASAMVLAGCGMPSDAHERAAATKESIGQAKKTVDEAKAHYKEVSKSDRFKPFAYYATQENWLENFESADKDIAHATSVYESMVVPILERNNKEDVSSLYEELKRIKASLSRARELSGRPLERLAYLREVRDNAPELVKKASEQYRKIAAKVEALRAKADKAATDYPDSEGDIELRFARFAKAEEAANTALQTAKQELKSERSDYVELGDAVTEVSAQMEFLNKEASSYSENLDSLYKSYSKVLVDMKSEFYVQIGRTSWDNYSDWNTDKNVIFSATQVDEATFDYFDSLADNVVIATIMPGWGGSKFNVKIDNSLWNGLSISEMADWPSRSHDAAQFWVNNTYVNYYHRYALVTDGQKEETGWKPVSAADYENHWENLGMAILTKPYGVFEDDAVDEATPPGLAYVGNDKYGTWKKDPSTGNSFWEFYGKYALMSNLLGWNRPHYYSRNEWSAWNSGGRGAYYGSASGGHTKYGTYSSRMDSSQYANSRFASQGGLQYAKSDVKSGKFNASRRGSASSVRGAGPSGRGGGPGGSGK